MGRTFKAVVVALYGLLVAVLAASVLVKLFMFFLNRSFAKAIGSEALKATAADSVSDAVATAAVLLSLLISQWTGFSLDGYMGAAVAVFIAFTGGWNDYLTPLLYMSRSFPTLASGIYLYEKKISYASNHPVYFAGVIISLIPILVLFGAFQNTIMSNVYAGGLKG